MADTVNFLDVVIIRIVNLLLVTMKSNFRKRGTMMKVKYEYDNIISLAKKNNFKKIMIMRNSWNNGNWCIVNKIAIKDALSALSARERQIIILRYFKDKTQSQIALQLGISQVQVSRIEKKVLAQMRDKIIC